MKTVGTPYGWVTAAAIGCGNATGYWRGSHPRPWTDTALLLTLPALIAGTMMSKRIRVALAAPAVAYICLLTRNRIKLWVRNMSRGLRPKVSKQRPFRPPWAG